MKQQRPKEPNIEGAMQWMDSITATPEGFSSGRWFQMMWPFILAAMFAGIAFIFVKLAIFAVRRYIYNRNRNHKRAWKNQAWRTEYPRQGKYNTKIPLPPDFIEDLQKQWDRVHDSIEEMLKFGDMLIELEDYVDNSFISNGNGNVGRRPGIKGFLRNHCPHIRYKTAMGYRTLALKAREIIKKYGEIEKVRKDCTFVYELGENMDVRLDVDHRLFKFKVRDRLPQAPDDPQPAIFSMREQAHSTADQLKPRQRKRFVSAMQELVRDLSVS